MAKNESKSTVDSLFKMFYYIAPIIGLILGIYYLQSKKTNDNIEISKERLEKVIVDIVENLDKKECIKKKELETKVKKVVSKMN